jgi:hypothetical protein
MRAGVNSVSDRKVALLLLDGRSRGRRRGGRGNGNRKRIHLGGLDGFCVSVIKTVVCRDVAELLD